ncbi:MAG: sigma-70 family RNA polymerase sigma factor [Ginsengibacter sp.]
MSEKEFLILIEENQKIIYKLVHLYASSEEDKKDLYQEIVLQSWKGFQKYKRESKFSTWLYKVCLNTIFTIKKQEKKIDYIESKEYSGNVTTYSHNEDSERLKKAIRTLPETERAIITLSLDGYNNGEISEILGISNNLVGVKIFRSKQHLSSLLKDI